jgi:dolichol-phosphate mannosyltransferase
MLAFAMDGILSFSQLPLKLASALGVVASVVAFLTIIYALVVKLFFPDHVIPGWSSVFTAVLFVGGVQLICLGVVGEYVGRIYEEIKGRPLYIVQEERNFQP